MKYYILTICAFLMISAFTWCSLETAIITFLVTSWVTWWLICILEFSVLQSFKYYSTILGVNLLLLQLCQKYINPEIFNIGVTKFTFSGPFTIIEIIINSIIETFQKG